MMLFTVTLISRAEKAGQEKGDQGEGGPSVADGIRPTPTAMPSPTQSSSSSIARQGATEEFFLELGSPELSVLRQNVTVERIQNDSRKGLWVRVLAAQVFTSGRPELDSRFLPTLDRLGALFSKWQLEVRVEASVSHDELIQRPYRNAWDLSAARAAAVVARLQKRNDFLERTLFAVATGYRPRGEAAQEIEFKIYDRSN